MPPRLKMEFPTSWRGRLRDRRRGLSVGDHRPTSLSVMISKRDAIERGTVSYLPCAALLVTCAMKGDAAQARRPYIHRMDPSERSHRGNHSSHARGRNAKRFSMRIWSSPAAIVLEHTVRKDRKDVDSHQTEHLRAAKLQSRRVGSDWGSPRPRRPTATPRRRPGRAC